jgi:hypothetical protein
MSVEGIMSDIIAKLYTTHWPIKHMWEAKILLFA